MIWVTEVYVRVGEVELEPGQASFHRAAPHFLLRVVIQRIDTAGAYQACWEASDLPRRVIILSAYGFFSTLEWHVGEREEVGERQHLCPLDSCGVHSSDKVLSGDGGGIVVDLLPHGLLKYEEALRSSGTLNVGVVLRDGHERIGPRELLLVCFGCAITGWSSACEHGKQAAEYKASVEH